MTSLDRPAPSATARLGESKANIAASPRRRILFATLITAIAGYLDAVGYAELGHLYVSFMSGNSTQLGMAIAGGRNVLLILVIIGAFVAGAALGTLIAEGNARFATVTVLSGEFAAFLLAILLVSLGHGRAGLALVAVAMGMQNSLHQAVAGADVGKGFITGALFGLGQSVARFLRGEAKIGQALSNAVSWGAFVVGVVIGACTIGAAGLLGSLVIVAILVLAVIAAVCTGWL